MNDGGGRMDAALALACRGHFGSIRAARIAAKVPARARPPWTEETLVREIRTHGSSKLPSTLMPAIRRLFGSTQAARQAAGVQVLHRTWSRQEVIEALRRGDPATGSLRNGCHANFGSVAAARTAAGLPSRLQRDTVWTEDRVIEALREYVRAGGRKLPHALESACAARFGSVTAARQAAGVPVLRRRQWTKETLVREIQKHGGLPVALFRAIKRFFGSTQAARQAAGVPVRGRGGRAQAG